jgi:hypothetical protein
MGPVDEDIDHTSFETGAIALLSVSLPRMFPLFAAFMVRFLKDTTGAATGVPEGAASDEATADAALTATTSSDFVPSMVLDRPLNNG